MVHDEPSETAVKGLKILQTDMIHDVVRLRASFKLSSPSFKVSSETNWPQFGQNWPKTGLCFSLLTWMSFY